MIPYCILAIENDSDRLFMERLYLNYRRLMYARIHDVTGDHWLTEDVIQSVLVKLIDKIDLLKELDQKRLVSYIVVSCKHTALNQVRKRSGGDDLAYEDYLTAADANPEGDSIEGRMIEKEQLELFAKLWEQLDERTRYLLESYYILERSMEELGEELKMKPASVRMALTRARRKAYKLLSTTEIE